MLLEDVECIDRNVGDDSIHFTNANNDVVVVDKNCDWEDKMAKLEIIGENEIIPMTNDYLSKI